MLFLRTVKGNMEIWQWVLLLSVLLPMAIKDFRTKKVNSYLCLITILEALLIRKLVINESDIVLLIDMIPGLLLLLVSVLTNEEIGKGDGLVLLYIGCVLGFKQEMEVLLIAFMLSGIIALMMLVGKKGNKKTEIPFVPFLSLGVIAGGLI